MIKSSCKGCLHRVPNCHVTCKDYKEFKAQLEQAHIKQREQSLFARATFVDKCNRHISKILRKKD